MITYRMSHPQLSHPLELESTFERTDRALIAWATLYILREFDEMVERDGWAIEALEAPAEAPAPTVQHPTVGNRLVMGSTARVRKYGSVYPCTIVQVTPTRYRVRFTQKSGREVIRWVPQADVLS
jgi:hypothetical protein